MNSSSITLCSDNDENPNTKGTDSSNFTITLPPHPNPKNYTQALVQVQSLHCPPLAVNPEHTGIISHDINCSAYGVLIEGLGVINSYVSGIPTNIVGFGNPHSSQLNKMDKEILDDDYTIRDQVITTYDTGEQIKEKMLHRQ